jgi:hypothetical protein
MLTEQEIRKRLTDLDIFWADEIKGRADKGKGGPWPADSYWYTYTRRAYLEILEESVNEE